MNANNPTMQSMVVLLQAVGPCLHQGCLLPRMRHLLGQQPPLVHHLPGCRVQVRLHGVLQGVGHSRCDLPLMQALCTLPLLKACALQLPRGDA